MFGIVYRLFWVGFDCEVLFWDCEKLVGVFLFVWKFMVDCNICIWNFEGGNKSAHMLTDVFGISFSCWEWDVGQVFLVR